MNNIYRQEQAFRTTIKYINVYIIYTQIYGLKNISYTYRLIMQLYNPSQINVH